MCSTTSPGVDGDLEDGELPSSDDEQECSKKQSDSGSLPKINGDASMANVPRPSPGKNEVAAGSSVSPAAIDLGDQTTSRKRPFQSPEPEQKEPSVDSGEISSKVGML